MGGQRARSPHDRALCKVARTPGISSLATFLTQNSPLGSRHCFHSSAPTIACFDLGEFWPHSKASLSFCLSSCGSWASRFLVYGYNCSAPQVLSLVVL